MRAPITLRYVLASSLCFIYFVYAIWNCARVIKGYKLGKIPWYVPACAGCISALGLLSMSLPNKEKDWINFVYATQSIGFLLTIELVDKMIDDWFFHTRMTATKPTRLKKMLTLILACTLVAICVNPRNIIIPIVLCMSSFYCSERLSGRIGNLINSMDSQDSRTRSSASSYAVRDALETMARILANFTTLLSASTGAFMAVHVLALYKPKLADLDFQYLGFFLSNFLGPIPITHVLSLSSTLGHLEALRNYA